jgi:tetratricopeptide (TPR) repeat protein
MAYIGLGQLYVDNGKLSQAEELFLKAMSLNPKNVMIYTNLEQLYRLQGKFTQAEELSTRVEDPIREDNRSSERLGFFYITQGKFTQAEELFKRTIELNSEEYHGYVHLGWLYRIQGKYAQAEEIFKRAIEADPKDDIAYAGLVELYREMGDYRLMKKYAKVLSKLRLASYSNITRNNYQKLKEVLDKRKIKLVCAQYPMRSVEPLKNIFGSQQEGVIFVDNEKVFKEAIARAGYREYFMDMCAGDFGHCTPKGNRLLAQSIANTISILLKNIFV